MALLLLYVLLMMQLVFDLTAFPTLMWLYILWGQDLKELVIIGNGFNVLPLFRDFSETHVAGKLTFFATLLDLLSMVNGLLGEERL